MAEVDREDLMAGDRVPLTRHRPPRPLVVLADRCADAWMMTRC